MTEFYNFVASTLCKRDLHLRWQGHEKAQNHHAYSFAKLSVDRDKKQNAAETNWLKGLWFDFFYG